MPGFLNSLSEIMGNISGKLYGALNRILPPEQRTAMLSRLQQFAINNPKLAAFLTAQIVLTGLPLLLFFTFTITVFLLALLVALILGLLAAVLFTVVMVLCALVIVLPTVFLTTFAATFLFLWGLGGYYILQWFNEGNMPAEPGTAVGDKLNNWTGGRMGWLMDGSRKKQTEKAMGLGGTPSVHGNGAKSNGSANGTNEREERHQPRKLEKENDQPTPTKQEGGVTKTDTKTASVNVGETT